MFNSKYFVPILFTSFLYSNLANATVDFETLWEKYAPSKAETRTLALKMPGQIIGEEYGTEQFEFNYDWKYRKNCYELHFEKADELAAFIYGLAKFTKDIKEDFPLDKFKKGVKGFHYSTKQVSDWIYKVKFENLDATKEELSFIDMLQKDGVIKITNDKVVVDPQIYDVLGAAPGKKKSFNESMRHERLHVIWEHDSNFRNAWNKKWELLSEEQQKNIKADFKNYNQNNIPQIIEEWAIKRSELDNSLIK